MIRTRNNEDFPERKKKKKQASENESCDNISKTMKGMFEKRGGKGRKGGIRSPMLTKPTSGLGQWRKF